MKRCTSCTIACHSCAGGIPQYPGTIIEKANVVPSTGSGSLSKAKVHKPIVLAAVVTGLLEGTSVFDIKGSRIRFVRRSKEEVFTEKGIKKRAVSRTVPIPTISRSLLSWMPSDNPRKTAQELNTLEEPLNTSECFLRFGWTSGVPATHIRLSSSYHMHLSMLFDSISLFNLPHAPYHSCLSYSFTTIR